MSIVPYVCDYCGTEWASPISASLCCDPAAFNDDTIERGID